MFLNLFSVCLVAIFLILLIVERRKPKRLVRLHQQLGNDWTYVPVVGNGLIFLGNNEDRMKKFMQMATQAYKKQHKAMSFWLGQHFHVAISDRDQACAVLKSALDKNYITEFTQPFTGNGSIFAPVDIWHRRRKFLNPTFAPRFVNQFVKVFEVQSKVLAAKLECRVGKGDFSCFESVSNYAMDSVCAADKLNLNLKSILDLMVEMSRDPEHGCTHKEIREEMVVLSVAGTDTSSVATCFTILMLAQYPDIQEKVYKEIQEHCGNYDKALEAGDFLKLKYLKAVIKESLRLYPPVPITSRYCKKDVVLPSGLVLPAGCNVVINIWGIHHNAEHWGEDVNEFNPNRFLSEQISPNTFQPFSFGSRNCIGQQYAMLSIPTTLVTLLRRFRFKPATNVKYDKNNPLRLTYDLMMKQVENFAIQIEYRGECNK